MPNASPSQMARAHARARALTPQQVRYVRLSLNTAAALGRELGVCGDTVLSARRGGRGYGPLRADERRVDAERQEQARRAEVSPPAPWEVLLVCDGPYIGPLDAQDRQEQLDAAYECKHGRLAGDPTVPCGCWPEERKPERVERLERFREQAERTPARVGDEIAA